MANPTGTTYLQANSSYSWVDGDIYSIAQTDQVEGAAIGASFGGLGVENQPHAVLLNKIQLTHVKQLADEVNIAQLLTFESLFTSNVNVPGYFVVGMQDVVQGQIQVICQWGIINTIGLPAQQSGEQTFGFNFPLIFPKQVFWILPWAFSSRGEALEGFSATLTTQGGPQRQSNTVSVRQLGPPGSYLLYQQPGFTGSGPAGIFWLALGY